MPILLARRRWCPENVTRCSQIYRPLALLLVARLAEELLAQPKAWHHRRLSFSRLLSGNAKVDNTPVSLPKYTTLFSSNLFGLLNQCYLSWLFSIRNCIPITGYLHLLRDRTRASAAVSERSYREVYAGKKVLSSYRDPVGFETTLRPSYAAIS